MAMLSMKEKLEILRDMTLEDDIFFYCCLDGSNECASLMLRIILGRDDLSVTRTETQRWVHNILEHSVRLDVHAADAMAICTTSKYRRMREELRGSGRATIAQ